MEYEIYYLCNILGVILIGVIILFHFVESEDTGKNNQVSENEPKEKLR